MNGSTAVARGPHHVANVWLATRMFGWALALPILKYFFPLSTLARLVAARPSGAERDAHRERRILDLARAYYAWLAHPQAGCLQRSLLAYRFLGEANARPSLHVGVRRFRGKVVGHAWVTVDGRPCGESDDDVRDFVPMVTFDSGGVKRRATP